MSLILSIETSSSICSAALHEAGEMVSHCQTRLEKPAGQAITSLIKQVFASYKAAIRDIEAVAVSAGPGSYTGLRAGVTIAKGLCFALSKPLIALDTLRIMTAEAELYFGSSDNYWYCPMIDARRMEVYVSLYDSLQNCILAARPLILSENSFEEILVKKKVLFFGSGAIKFLNLIGNKRNATFTNSIYPTSLHMGRLAWAYYKEKKFESLAECEPLYLKEVTITQSGYTC